jgi:hypothetical protein
MQLQRQHHLELRPEDLSERSIRMHNRIVLAEAVGYYSLIGVAAVGAFLLR